VHICVLAITYTCEYSVTTLSSVEVVQLNPLVLQKRWMGELMKRSIEAFRRGLLDWLIVIGRLFCDVAAPIVGTMCIS
jgi:hypothetical protein